MTHAPPRRDANLRVGLLIESDGPGGAESVLHSLAVELRELGHVVFPAVLTPGQGWLSGRLRSSGFSVFGPTIRTPIDPRFAAVLAQWVRTSQLDVLHAHEFTMGFYSGVAGLLAGRPHGISMHGGKTFAAALRRRAALKFSASRASFVAAVSTSTRDHLARAIRRDPSTIELVPNGVRPEQGNREQTRRQLHLKPDERLLLAVGNLYPVKGHRVLVDAAAELAKRTDLPGWRIAIAGRGEEQQALLEQISAHGLGDSVQLLGLRDDIPDLLAAADVWTMPSLSEGMPIAMLEAMSRSLPVVATAVGGIPDLVEDGKTGLLTAPSDAGQLAEAMGRLLLDPALGRRLGENGKRQVDMHFGSRAMTQHYVRLYERAVSRAGA